VLQLWHGFLLSHIAKMRFDIITIFPKIFDSYFKESILARAIINNTISIHTHNPRKFTKDKHHTLDDKPYGGGAGMVLMAEPILQTVEHIRSLQVDAVEQRRKQKIVILSAKGKQFNQKLASQWAKKYERIIMIAGRYEGIDERVRTALRAEEISIGPYVLTDGDVASMVVMSAVSRLIPGVINLSSLAEESHWNLLLKKEEQGTGITGLEYPHYTRPEVLEYKGKKYRVPKVLISGNHKKIDAWRNTNRRG
jgi:tRNA (guanine37-N1)-methyltransferase